MKTILRAAAVLMLVGVATPAFAQFVSATGKQYSVPGVINNGLATVFSCTNASAAAVSVSVDVFDQNGALSGFGTASIPASKSANFGTNLVAAIPGLTNLGAGDVRGGSARIVIPSTAIAKVFCAAFIISPTGDPPSVMMALPVIKGIKQIGA